ncbi:MAG: CTP synthase, partial [Planctomycetes bacterium]|nr:CTP synthase [Planctomycetota bacterium]
QINVAIIGKYISIYDSYKSIYEALYHGGFANSCKINILTIDSERIEEDPTILNHNEIHGILIPGGFGHRGIEGKVKTIQYARTNKIPFFGICLGFQVSAIEFARNVLNLKGANSDEFDKTTHHPVIHLLPSQKNIKEKGATMRLGSYKCRLTKGLQTHKSYGKDTISERHRHRYEFNNAYRKAFIANGFLVSGCYEQDDLVEIMELKGHPWFIGVQFHPEFQSKPHNPHPLFRDFIKSCINFKEGIHGREIRLNKTNR